MNIASALGNGTEGPARWSLRLLGGFELSVLPGGERVALLGKRERVLLAYLALSPNYRQPRRKLTTLLWGDAADETALDNLRVCIWKLRKALGHAEHRVIASEGEDIVLDAAAFEVDVLTFRHLAAQSDRTELDVAAKLYVGEFLDGLDIESEESLSTGARRNVFLRKPTRSRDGSPTRRIRFCASPPRSTGAPSMMRHGSFVPLRARPITLRDSPHWLANWVSFIRILARRNACSNTRSRPPNKEF